MLFSDTLEVAIGLTFIFLLVSLITTAIVEFLESFRRKRGTDLYQGIKEMLADSGRAGSGEAAAAVLYGHPLLQGLYVGDFTSASAQGGLPSYLPSRSFALALIDQALAGKVNPALTCASLPEAALIGDRLRFAAERVDNEQVRQALCLAVQVGGNDVERIAQHLAGWFDAAMERVGGRYKRHMQRLTFGLGLGAAVFLNVNTLIIADALSKDATLRRAVVAQAEAAQDMPQAREAIAQIDRTGLPVGWSDHAKGMVSAQLDKPLPGFFQLLLGYLLTAFAVSLGAPFWFDTLKKLMVIRGTVKPGEAPAAAPASSEAVPPPAPAAAVAVPIAAVAVGAPGLIDSDIYAEIPTLGERLFEE